MCGATHVQSTELMAAARRVRPGQKIAVPVDYAGVSMAMTRALIKHGAGDLHLVCIPTGGLQVDQLIGAGLVRTVETSAVSLAEAGGAPRFNDAVKQGRIEIRDATCPAIHAGLMAAQKGIPFMPIRGLIGSDVLRYRPDWRTIDNPFGDGSDPIVVVPAINPDIAIFHAPMADRLGNVWVGRRKELAAMTYASKSAIVTVERIVERNLLSDETDAAGVIPSIYIEQVVVAPNGARPYGLWGEYEADGKEILRYAKAAKTPEGFTEYMRTFMTEEAAAS